MNARFLLLVPVICMAVFAQGDQKFQLYGFADMTLTKYFPKDHSIVRNVDKMDERMMFALDHINLYQDYRPNDRVRFLTELSFQDVPVYYKPTNGMRIRMNSPFFNSDSVYTEASLSDSNQIMKGIVKYEWGSFSVERAQLFLNVNRYINLTFGKFITPAGIWNVDHGSPVIMTVSQPSQYSYREIYPKSQLGIMDNGSLFFGDVDLSYNIYISSGRGNMLISKPSYLSTGGQVRIGLPALDELNIGLSGYTGIQTAVNRTLVMDMNTTDFVNFDYEYSISDHKIFKYRENVFGFDFKARKSIFSLQAELNYQYAVNHMRDDKKSSVLGTYVLGSVEAYKKSTFMLTPYAYWELVKYNDTKNNPSFFSGPVDETSSAATTANFSVGYIKAMAGLNMKIMSNFGIKTEFNFTRLLMSDTADPNDVAKDDDGLNDIPGVTAQFYISF